MGELMEKDEDIEDLDERLEDLREDLMIKEAVINDRERMIASLKKENQSLKQQTSRQSLNDSNSSSLYKLKVEEKQREIGTLQDELRNVHQYIDKLSFYMRQTNDIALPTPKE